MQIAAIRSTESTTRGRHCINTHHGRTRNQGVKRLLSYSNVAVSEKRGEVENDTKIRKEATPVRRRCRLCCHQGIFKNNKRFPFSRLVMQKIG